MLQTIRGDTMFKAEEFPRCVTDLDATLTDVDGNNFSHSVLERLVLEKYFDLLYNREGVGFGL